MTSGTLPETVSGGGRLKKTFCMLGATFFLAAIPCAFVGFVPITEFLSKPWWVCDPYWEAAYAAASVAAALLLPVMRGRLLLIASLVGLLALLLIPAVLGHAAAAILLMAWVTVLSVGLGHRCLRWIAPRLTFSLLEDVLLSTMVGYGVLTLVVLAIGSLQLLQPVWAYWILAVLTAAVVPDLYALYRRIASDFVTPLPGWWRGADARLPGLAAFVFLICSFGGYVWAIGPAVHSDALTYHLALPKLFVHHGGIFPVVEHHLFCHIRTADMLFLLGLLIEGQTLAGLFHFVFALLTAGLLFCLGVRTANVRVGIFAACLFYALPLVTWESGTAYIDLFVTGFTLAAVYSAVRWWKEDEPAWLTLMGLMGGLAVGTKLNGAIFIAPIICLVVARLVSRHGWRRLPGCMARLCLPGLLVAGPWFLQAWIWTGNPVFPMLNSIFQSPLYPSEGNQWFNWHTFGWGTTWPYFFRLPWDLNFHSVSFGELSVAAFAGMSLFGLPWTILQASRSRRRLMAVGFLFATASLGVLFTMAQYYRYMLPVFTVLALTAALNIEHTWELIGRWRWRRGVVVFGVVIAMAWLTCTRVVDMGVSFYTVSRYPWEVFVGRETPEQFLQRDLRQYDVLRFIAEKLEGDPPRLIVVGKGLRRYYTEDAVLFHSWYPESIVRLCNLTDHQQVLDVMRENRIDYLVLEHTRLETLDTSRGLTSKAFLESYGYPVFSRNGTTIYRILPKEIVERIPAPRTLLENSGFELIDGEGSPAGWLVWGNPTIETSGTVARSSSNAVRMSFEDHITQTRSVRQDALYTISAFVRADRPEQKADLVFLWLDEKGKIMGMDRALLPVGEHWEYRESVASCRPGAVQCRVVLRGAPGCEVWFDDVQLSERVGTEYVANR